ncbi:Helicase [Gracilaria domingensis]|nr:Helicase [Gracilaria domingensis]
MELNISVSEPTRLSKSHLIPKGKLKGSWRKRRREEVQQKIRSGIREANGKQTLGAKLLESDEFASGIEGKKAPDRSTDRPKHRDRAPKRQRHTTSLERLQALPNIVIEDGSARRNYKDFPGEETKPKRTAENLKGSSTLPKTTETRESIEAALSVIRPQQISRSVSKEQAMRENSVEEIPAYRRKEENEYFSSKTFEDLGLYRSICYHLNSRMSIEMPTKVQGMLLNTMLNLEDGQLAVDVLVRSATGSGKTLAYLLPIAHYLLNRRRRITREDGAMAILVVPTRELADQVEDVANRLFRPWHWIVTGSVVGGESKKREKARLRKGISVLVATPGRLLDHLRNTRSFKFDSCEFLILDEADRLLDLGFEPEVKEIIDRIEKKNEHERIRSNILLSATLRKDVERLASFSLQDPIEISVNVRTDSSGRQFSMPTQLKQHFCIVEQRHRLVTLACFLRLRALKVVSPTKKEVDVPECKIIVFFSTCDSVDFHYELFKRLRLPQELGQPTSEKHHKESFVPLRVCRIHGNHSQKDRTEALRDFRQSSRAVLLCTDVAARGLDLSGLSFAVQYDPPTGGQGEELEYLHRAGRTARIGAQGDALLFLLPSERAYIGKLEANGVSITEISGSAALASLYPKVNLRSQDSISYAMRFVTSVVQENLEKLVQDDESIKRMAVAGFQAYCRAYATHAREVRHFFHVRNLHLGHVARSFTLSDKPAEFSELIKEARSRKRRENEKSGLETVSNKGDIARAIASDDVEKGRGVEAMKELAMEFGGYIHTLLPEARPKLTSRHVTLVGADKNVMFGSDWFLKYSMVLRVPSSNDTDGL